MRILGIETSCDETAIAIIEVSGRLSTPLGVKFSILSNIVSSQVEVHKKWGGVVPSLAKREHQKNLVPVLRSALKDADLLVAGKAGSKKNNVSARLKIVKDILEREPELYKKIAPFLLKYETPAVDAMAIVNGPGLEPALWVGINFAKAMAFWWKKPIIPVNHLEGHLFVNWLNGRPKDFFPTLCLLVSGGHTMLILMEDVGKYKLIGETRDDSAGECFDKTARVLGLGYPGGPAIAVAAEKTRLQVIGYRLQVKLPRPMLHSKDYDFSFSGLKTAVLYNFQQQPAGTRKSKKYITVMAAEIQQAIIDVLMAKTLRAAKEYKVKTLMIGGGVTANKELRRQLREKVKKELPAVSYLEPDPALCTDNGVMAAMAGYFDRKKSKRGTDWRKIEARGNMSL